MYYYILHITTSDSFGSKFMRLISVIPTMIILATNMAGFIINVMKPNNFKSMLKAILALNIVRESVEVCFNVFMILFRNEFTSIPKEVYFGRFFSNIWWLSLCVSFSKSRWVSSKGKATNIDGRNINMNAYMSAGNRGYGGDNNNNNNNIGTFRYGNADASSSGPFSSLYDSPGHTDSNDTY